MRKPVNPRIPLLIDRAAAILLSPAPTPEAIALALAINGTVHELRLTGSLAPAAAADAPAPTARDRQHEARGERATAILEALDAETAAGRRHSARSLALLVGRKLRVPASTTRRAIDALLKARTLTLSSERLRGGTFALARSEAGP